MRRTTSLIVCAQLLLFAAPVAAQPAAPSLPTARAPEQGLSPAVLRQRATHVIVGKVQRIYTRKRLEIPWQYTRYVAEVQVTKVEKGTGIRTGQVVFARYWERRWLSASQPPSKINGHASLPDEGATLRVFLARYASDGFDKENKDGGFNVLIPNGFEHLSTGAGIPAGTYQASRQSDWRLVLKPIGATGKGAFQVLRQGKEVVVEGLYSIRGDRFTLTDAKGTAATKEAANKSGVYRFQLRDKTIKFAAVTDGSIDRRLVLTANEWKRVE